VLQGRCGRTTERNPEQLAPCHLQLDPTIDPLLADDVEDVVCEVCGTDELDGQLLLCELCNQGWHTFCLQPPLANIPDGYWVCPNCTAAGKTEADAARLAQQREQQAQQQQLPNIFPDAPMRRRDAAAEALHGRFITRVFKDPITKRPRTYWGKLHYLGPHSRPNYFRVIYEDGDEQAMSTAVAKKHLKSEGTQLPAGVSIPEPATLAMLQQQLICCLGQGIPATAVQQLTAAAVPAQAIELLVDFMQSSLELPLYDPLTFSQSTAAALQSYGLQLSLSQPHSGCVGMIVSPAADSLTACLSALKQLRFKWAACYLAQGLNKQQKYLVQLISVQRGSTLVMRKQHRWLVLG
jgi:hypothetical protein